jgi:hypothetical protein
MKTIYAGIAALTLLAIGAPAQAQTYSYLDPVGNLVVSPYAGVERLDPSQGGARQDFYGGYNTGPYAGQYGFYRRLPSSSRFTAPSYQRRFNPYHRIDSGGRQHMRHFGGVEFYGF